MGTTTQPVTAEQFMAMGIDHPCELIAGEVAMLPYNGGQHGAIAGSIAVRLGTLTRPQKMGRVLPVVGFIIARNPDTVRAPDIAYIREARVPEIRNDFITGHPDLAVEVVSHTDCQEYIDAKTQAWLDAGTPIVWVVWPATRSVVIHQPGQEPVIRHEKDTITGEEVVPGFQCIVGEFFSD